MSGPLWSVATWLPILIATGPRKAFAASSSSYISQNSQLVDLNVHLKFEEQSHCSMLSVKRQKFQVLGPSQNPHLQPKMMRLKAKKAKNLEMKTTRPPRFRTTTTTPTTTLLKQRKASRPTSKTGHPLKGSFLHQSLELVEREGNGLMTTMKTYPSKI
mmetsp:Transcript_52916/g.154178  ORF Transcript_52916/g.154178 Transcript_52916/m.154178 type:complete len:158 (-) Transcript_52916:470-943(-)